MRRVLSMWLFAGILAHGVGAQESILALSDRAPRFLLASATGGVITPRVVDASAIVALRRDVTINLADATLGEALREVGRQIGVRFVYSADVVPVDTRVHLTAKDISAAGALSELLMGKGLDVLFKISGQAVLVKRDAAVDGSICGTVTEANSGQPVADAEIRVLGTSLGASTDKRGQYCIGKVPVGEYTVSARRLGYRTKSISGVVVVSGQSIRADFPLNLMPSTLDQVVVTGTAIPTERKALPNPITVVTDEQLKKQHINNIDDVFRFFVPGGVTVNAMPGIGGYSLNSVRGASTFEYLTSTLKVLVDGVQMADVSQLRSIDPGTIDHIEVLTGPEATTIYGSGAISGVMQIFLKHGSPNLTRPQLSGKLAVGTIDNRYNPGATPLSKNGSLSLVGGNGTYGYSAGGSWRQEGAWTRFNDVQETGLFIGARFEQGIFGGDISIRNTRMSGLPGLNPARIGGPYGIDTTIAPRTVADLRYATYAGTLRLQPVAGWNNTLTVGEDVNSGRVYSSRPATAADAAAEFVPEGTYSTDKSDWAVRTVDFKSSYGWSFSNALKFNVVAGANRITTDQSVFSSVDSLPPENASFTGPIYSNQSLDYVQGVFGQGQLSWNDAVFLTAGAHGDRSPGENATVWSPRVGLSVVRRVGAATVKGRIEYGSSLIAPEPFEKMYIVNRFTVQLANPNLLPQKQHGTDMGLEVYLGNRLSVTGSYYNQMAVDLLTQTFHYDPAGSTTQWVNVGRVHNTGWEFTGTAVPFSRLSLQFVYGSASSIIEEISSPLGSYKTGDRILDVPKWTGGVTAVWSPFDGTSINLAATHTGTQRDIDLDAENAALDNGTYDGDPLTERQFWTDFPAYTLVNVGLTQRLMRNVSAFVQLENVGNVYPFSQYWVIPRGRVSMIGLQFSSF